MMAYPLSTPPCLETHLGRRAPASKIQLSPKTARSEGPESARCRLRFRQPDDASDVRWETAIKAIDLVTTGNFPRRRFTPCGFFPDHPVRASPGQAGL